MTGLTREIVPIDQNGHRITNDTVDLGMYRLLNKNIGSDDPRVMYPLKQALEFYHECTWCGQRPDVELDEAAKIVRVLTPCPAINGVENIFTLHVPSGKIVVDDDLREWYRIPREQEDAMTTYNSCLGQTQYSQAMAALGCAYGPVGNTCPTLYHVGDDDYIIANPAYDEESGEPKDTLGEPVAHICTDLWAYSIADYDDWVSKGGGDVSSWTRTVVDVRPGTYRFIHHTGERTFDRDEWERPVIYAHMEWIG